MRIAISTPTGQVGSKVVNLLIQAGGHDLVLLARQRSKVASFAELGARVFEGDLVNEDFVVDSTRAVEALFWVNPPVMSVLDDRQFARELADNAAAAITENHIRHTVYLSSIGAHLEHGTGIISTLHDVEVILSQAAEKLTILRCGYFMENYLTSLDSIVRDGAIFLPVSADVRVPMVATRDIAAAAAEILQDPSPPPRQIVPLAGPKDYSFGEAAEIIGQAIGYRLEHVRISGDQARQHLIDSGASPNVADRLVAMYDAIERGIMVGEQPRDRQMATPTMLEQFAQAVLAPAVQRIAAQI